MPMPWPASLPQRFDKDGYQDAFADNRHATQTDLGPALIRSRISSMPRKIAGVMKMDKTQLERLRQFWKVDTLDGKLPFLFPDPVFGTGEYKNYIPNSTYAGAVPGSPGTLPAGWSGAGDQNGVTKRVAEIGVEEGLQYVDIEFAGTATGPADIIFAAPPIAAVSDQTWTESLNARLVSGSKVNIDKINVIMYNSPETTSSGLDIRPQLGPQEMKYQRYAHTWRPSVIGMTGISPRFQVVGTPGIFFTIRIRLAGVQLEKANSASEFIVTPNTGTPITRFAAGGAPPQPTFLGGKTWGVNIELEIFET